MATTRTKTAPKPEPQPDGFRPEVDEYTVTYDEPNMRGLVAHFEEVPVGDALDLDVLRFGAPSETPAERKERLTDLYGIVAGVLAGWNLLHPKTGQPVPPTVAGLMSLKQDFVNDVIAGYINALRGVSAPLGDGSTSGDPSLEASIPMEAL